MLLENRCIQSYPYFEITLLPKFWTSTCQDFHQIASFTYTHTWMCSLDLPYLCPPLEIWLLIIFLISFNNAFRQSFFDLCWKSGDFYKILGSGIKSDTSETDSPKYSNELFNYFITTLKILCKIFPILFAESYTPLHSLCAFLIWSRMFNIAYLALIFGFTCFTYQMSSGEFILIYLSS